jgi:hypothetical protein
MPPTARFTFAALSLLFGLVGEAAADPVPPGTRIRVETTPATPGVKGDLVSWTVHEIVLRPDSTSERTLALKMTPETRVWESRGQHGHGWLGAGLGLVVGGGIAAMIFSANEDDYEAPPVGLVVYPLVGIFTGTLMGSGIKTERWREVPNSRSTMRLREEGLDPVLGGLEENPREDPRPERADRGDE